MSGTYSGRVRLGAAGAARILLVLALFGPLACAEAGDTPAGEAQVYEAEVGKAGGEAGAHEAAAHEAPADEAPASDAAREPPVVLVTGSTGGLGRELARTFAERGAHVIVHGRDVERGEALVAEVEAGGRGSARFYRADLASFADVREFAEAVRRDHDRLDLLVNNAGINLPDRNRRFVTEDGAELHFQVNYLSGFLLTHELLPLLLAAAPSRIVNVSSRGQTPIDFSDPQIERGYSGGRAYGQSKLAQITFTMTLAERLEGTGVSVHAVHPAGLMDTDLVRGLGVEPRATVQEGVEAVLFVATEAEGSGLYFHQRTPADAHPQAYDEEARERLWRLSEELTGVAWDPAPRPGSR